MAEEKSLITAPKDSSGEKPIRIRRGRVDSVDLYEIKDSELDLLEKGSPAGIYLNFAIFLLSIAFSALAALCTAATFKHAIIQTLFIVLMVVAFLLGALLLLLWYKGRSDVGKVIIGIRNRIPSETLSTHPGASLSEVPADEQPNPAEPKG